MAFLSRTFSHKKNLSRTPRVESNQSMMDLILSGKDVNTDQNDRQNPDSEHNLNNSSNKASLNDEISSDFPSDKIGRQTNIMSVLNKPMKASLLQDVYSIFQDYVTQQQIGHEIIDNNITGKIEESNFGHYISAVNQTYSVYKKNNQQRLKKMKQKDKVDTKASLKRCYELVPKEYLSKENYFNFGIFVDSLGQIIRIQENLGQYLDLIEVNLHYQITERFQEFLDVILKINQMEAQIENALYEIKFFRNFNSLLKENSKQNVIKLSKLQKRKINIHSTLELLTVIHLINKLSKKEKEMTKNEDLELKAKLVKAMQQADKDKLHQIRLLREVNFISKQIKIKIQEQFASEFQERCFNYIKPTLIYRRVIKPNAIEDSSIFEDAAAFDDTYIDTQASVEDSGDYSHIPWTLNNLPRDNKTEDAIANVVLEYAGIGSFPSSMFQEKLLTLLKTFHKQFISDMNEYQKEIGLKIKEKNHEMFNLTIQFVFLYLGIFKQFIDKYLNLNCKILQKLVDYYQKKIANKVLNFSADGKRINIEDRETLLFNQTIQNFCSALASVFEYFTQKVAEQISCYDIHALSIRQFVKIDSVFREMLDIVDNRLKVKEKLDNCISCKDSQINNHVASLVSCFNDRICLKKMRELRLQTNKEFILGYHKRQLNTLKETLEEESWVPATIPYSFGTILESFLNDDRISEKDLGSAELASSQDFPETTSPEEELYSSQKLEDIDIEQIDVEKSKRKESFDIKRHALNVFGQNFKIVPSLLQLMKIIYDYFNIQRIFKLIEIDTISKIFDVIEFYNSRSRQIILQEDILGRQKKIKAKNISLSLNSVVLLESLMNSIYQKIINELKDYDLGWLSLEFTKVKQNLNNHINELSFKLHNVLETKLLQQCNELEKMNWGIEDKINIPTKQSANILHNTWQFYRVVEEDLLQGYLFNLFKNILTDIKDHYLKIFEEVKVENILAAKRLIDELKYFSEEIRQISIYNNMESGFPDFEQRVSSIVKKLCDDFQLEIH